MSEVRVFGRFLELIKKLLFEPVYPIIRERFDPYNFSDDRDYL